MVEQVRILKNGIYNGFRYKKGEIYNIKKKNSNMAYLDVFNGGQNVIVSYVNSIIYGIECEFIETDNIYELW